MINDDEFFSKTPSNKIFIKYFFTILLIIILLQLMGFFINMIQN